MILRIFFAFIDRQAFQVAVPDGLRMLVGRFCSSINCIIGNQMPFIRNIKVQNRSTSCSLYRFPAPQIITGVVLGKNLIHRCLPCVLISSSCLAHPQADLLFPAGTENAGKRSISVSGRSFCSGGSFSRKNRPASVSAPRGAASWRSAR